MKNQQNKNQPQKTMKQDEISESSFDNSSQSQANHSLQSQSDDQQGENMSQGNQNNNQKQLQLQLEQQKLKTHLKQIPFGQLIKYNRNKQKVAEKKQIKKDRSMRQLPQQKSEKNAPRQIKIMRRPPKNKLKVIFQSQRSKGIDPRFEEYAGNYNQDLAASSYSFIRQMQNNQISYLKKQIGNKRISQPDKEILVKSYNKLTNDVKRYEHGLIQKKVKSEYKNKNFRLKKRQFRQEVQRQKLSALNDRDQDKRLKKKQKKIQKLRTIEKKKFINRANYNS